MEKKVNNYTAVATVFLIGLWVTYFSLAHSSQFDNVMQNICLKISSGSTSSYFFFIVID